MLVTNPVVPGNSLVIVRMVGKQHFLKITKMNDGDGGQAAVHQDMDNDGDDDDCVNSSYTTEAQFP
jgi:hypothetical protein